ncbi:hypothetical protein N7475_001477 [Penicillium sp. IBT 31633x]|nr:hypothetical protein N7475_001477 [Penicillium sp. IBT 31633x]
MPSPWPALSDDESDTSSHLPEIFSNNASDSDSSTAPSVFDSSSESESESEDELASEDEEEFCNGIKRGPVECLSWLSNIEETVRFLKALFS